MECNAFISKLISGFVKTSYHLTFKGAKMERFLKHFCHDFEVMTLPSEFPRKARTPINNLKASEYRTIALVAFVLFSEVFAGRRERIVQLRRFWLIQVNIYNIS